MTLMGRWRAFLILSVGALYAWLCPPLYNRDGYIYHLQGIPPLDYLNPHHLLWIPIQALISAASAALGLHSTVLFQSLGVLVNLATLYTFFRLLEHLFHDIRKAAVSTVFLAFSPQFWFLAFQNQPYPLVFLSVILFLKAWRAVEDRRKSGRKLVLAGAALGIATLLQQAAVLLVAGAAAAWVLAGRRPWRNRLSTASLWSAATGGGVAVAYGIGAASQGVRRPADFRYWMTDYLRIQNGLQVAWFRSLAQSVIGLGRSLIQLHDLELYLTEHWTEERILAMYLAAGIALGLALLVGAACPRIRRRLAETWRNEMLWPTCAGLVLAWSVFAFCWQPVGYYWSVVIIPLLLLAAWVHESASPPAQRAGAVVLLCLSAWNLWANHREDQAAAARAPEPLLAKVEARLGPRDLLIVPARDWLEDVDYDVLLSAWDYTKKVRALSLLENFILVPGPARAWPRALQGTIDSVLAKGGAVYISDLLFRKDLYEELAATDAYTAYRIEAYENAGGPRLYREVAAVLIRYPRRDAHLAINSDFLWQLSPVKANR